MEGKRKVLVCFVDLLLACILRDVQQAVKVGVKTETRFVSETWVTFKV
jgi:hypothetical protein